MKKITVLLIFFTFQQSLSAQNEMRVFKNNFEFSLKYALQRPYYSVSNFFDIIAFSHDKRYRSRISIGCRYYFFEKWFTEYLLAYSQDGGGFTNQFTNANYLKNSIYIGFASNQNKKIIFDIYTGLDFNCLINSCFVNKTSGFSENVNKLYNRFSIHFPVIGTGFKTKIFTNTFFSIQTYLSLSNYQISNQQNTKVMQVIFPAFQVSISKFIK